MNQSQLRLGVNIDHVATLRQVRGVSYPSPSEAARLCVAGGAHGITVHLREDRRHIQDADVRALCAERLLPVNLELANTPEIVDIALELLPNEVCVVPEKREELTTEGGLDAAGHQDALRKIIPRFKERGIDVSLFIEADPAQVRAAADLGAPTIELHTGTYCDAGPGRREDELERLRSSAVRAHELGLKVNAGHGLNLENIGPLLDIPHLDTLNIGHSIVARSVFVGLKEAVREMLEAMAAYRGGRTR